MAVEEVTPDFIPGARIKVLGVWGWGWNAANRMIREGLDWVEYITINTDAQALSNTLADKKVNIGLNMTKWLWAWADPETGKKAAEENIDEIKKHLEDTDMVFVTAGMWGGTWTGAAPVIAAAAKEMGILTVWVVTKPFGFEGRTRGKNSSEGLEKLQQWVDTLIVIPNDKIFNIIDKKTTFKQAFSMIDKILLLWVQWISDLIINPGDINVDFADIKAIMKDSGSSLLGIGYWEWENRAVDAARQAIDNPLLDASLEGAQNIVFAVTGWEDLTPIEVQEAARVVEEIADESANIIWWMTFDESYDGEVKVSIIATWFPEETQNVITWAWEKWSSYGSSRRWRGENFVNKALQQSQSSKSSSSQSSASSNQSSSSSNEDEDYETPAFLRKKLGNS